MSWQDRIPEVQRRFEALTDALADPAVLESRERYTATAREHSELAPVVEAATRWQQARARLDDVRDIIAAGEDVEVEFRIPAPGEAEITALTRAVPAAKGKP